MTINEQLLSLIRSLAEAHPFTVEYVSRLTGIELKKVPSESNNYFEIFASQEQPDGPIATIELRVPTGQAGAEDGLLLLQANPRSSISKDEIRAKFGKKHELSVPTPRQPITDPLYFIYHMQWGEAKFGFARDRPESLTTIVLDATNA